MDYRQHIARAERLLADVQKWEEEAFSDDRVRKGITPMVQRPDIASKLQRAKVHAILALAAGKES